MTTSLKGVLGAVVGISAFLPVHTEITGVANAASGKMLLPGKRVGQTPAPPTGDGTTTPPSGTPPSSVSSATVLVNAGSDVSQTGANDLAAARALFRSASYPESDGGLGSSAELLNGIAAKATRIINAESGSSIDGSGNIAMTDRLRQALSSIKQHGYTPHVVVGQRQPAYLTKPASQWTGGDWATYSSYATSFVRAVVAQFEQTGFPEALFEVGHEIAVTADPLQLWTLSNPSVPPGDEARYQHYLRVFEVWSQAVARVAKEYPSRTVRIGGPAMGGQSLYAAGSFWHERFIQDVASRGMRLDALTHHFYGDLLNGWPNVTGSALKPQLQRMRQALEAAGRGTVPILVTEYGPSESSDSVFGRINYSHEGAAWAAAFIGEALGGSATVGSYALVRDNIGAAADGVPGIASLDHTHGGVDYPKPAYNALRMFTLLPGTRKAVTTAATQPDVRAFGSSESTSAGLLAYNYNFRYNYPSEATDLTVNQSVTPGFYNLPFTGAVAVERYLVDASTSNAGRFIDAQQAPDHAASALTRVEQCAATVDQAGALLLPARVLGPSAVSLWIVKAGGAAGLPACATTPSSGDTTTTPTTGDTTTPTTGDTTTPTTGDTTTPTTGDTTTPTTGDTTTPTTGGTTSGSTGSTQDFATRCAAAGVIKCVGFDSATDIAGGAGSNTGIDPGTSSVPVIDSAVSASGGGSLKFTIPSNSGSNSSGAYFANFSPDLSVQFGENAEFYVQWRQRFSPEFISTFYNGSGGIKQAIITTGDQPGRTFASCEAIGVVLQTYYMNRFPILYNSCTGSTSHGPYDGFYEPVPGDFKLQNARLSPYCLYTQSPSNFFPPNGNCFGWFSDEWMTFQIHIKTGPRVNDEWTDSYVTLWMAREGKPSELVTKWGPYNLTAGTPTSNQKFGKVYLLPYQTSKDSTHVHPTAYTWYDELIISRTKIAEPAASGTTRTTSPEPQPQPTGDTTAPSAPGGLAATASGSTAVDLSWNASTDNTGVTGYRIYRCTGSGCTPATQVGTVTGTAFADTGLAASTTYSYRVAAYDAAGNVSAHSSMIAATTQADTTTSTPPPATTGTPNTTLQALGANSLMKLPSLVCTDAEGEYPGNCKEITGYAGMVYDQNRQRMVLFGGGHGGTNYDAIPTLDMTTLKWSEEYRPTPCSSMTLSNYSFERGAWISGPSGPYPRPAARHTLDEMMVVGDELVVLANVEGNAPCLAAPNNIASADYTSYELATGGKAAHYNFATKTWSFADTIGVASVVFPAAEYDPVSRKVVIFGTNGLEIYDPATRTKTVAMDFGYGSRVKDEQGNTVPAAELSYNKTLVYYPPTQKFYYFGETEVFEISLDRTNFAASAITKLSTGYTLGKVHMGYAYDSVNKVIGTIRQNTFYAFNPATKSWSSRVMSGGTPGSVSYKAISYDQVNNAFVFISEAFPGGGAFETWAYRYATGQ